MECVDGGGPPMNTDVSGIGVRLSFYLQTLFLSCLSVRSDSLEDKKSALNTLLSTNTAMVVTALILGLKPNPEISFHDALVVFYLMCLSGIVIFFCLPAFARYPGNEVLRYFSIVQSYTIFTFGLILLTKATNFGSFPECNPNAVIVLLRPFTALKAGRVIGWVLTVLFATGYTALLVKDLIAESDRGRQLIDTFELVTERVPARHPTFTPLESVEVPPSPPPSASASASSWEQYRNERNSKKQQVQKQYILPIDWNVVVQLIVVTILWSLAIMNTELLIRWNNFAPLNGSSWQFGQVLPMFLLIIPLSDLINTFRKLGLRPLPPPIPGPEK